MTEESGTVHSDNIVRDDTQRQSTVRGDTQ